MNTVSEPTTFQSKGRNNHFPGGKDMSEKRKFQKVGQYLVSKSGVRYIKFELERNKAGQDLVFKDGDSLYVNMFQEEFRTEHNIPDFVKGSVSVELKPDAKDTF